MYVDEGSMNFSRSGVQGGKHVALLFIAVFFLISIFAPMLGNSSMPVFPLFVGAFFASCFMLTFLIAFLLRGRRLPLFLTKAYPYSLTIVVLPFVSVYAAFFYTGRMPHDLLYRADNAQSAYVAYQYFFAENLAGTTAFERSTGIVSLALLKLLVLYSIFYWALWRGRLVYGKPRGVVVRNRYKGSFLLIVALFSYLYFSAARGTNFELFELLFFGIASVSAFCPSLILGRRFFLVKLILLFVICFLAIAVFEFRVRIRSDLVCYSSDICFLGEVSAEDAWSRLRYVFFLLSGYFSFGFYFLGVVVLELYSGSVSSLLFWGASAGGHANLACDIYLDCGVNWESYISQLVALGGVSTTLVVAWLLGRLASILYSTLCIRANFWCFILYAIVYSLVASIFFGNFFVSSSNVVVLFLAVLGMFKSVPLRSSTKNYV